MPIVLRIVLVVVGVVGGCFGLVGAFLWRSGRGMGPPIWPNAPAWFINMVSRPVMFVVGVAMLVYAVALRLAIEVRFARSGRLSATFSSINSNSSNPKSRF